MDDSSHFGDEVLSEATQIAKSAGSSILDEIVEVGKTAASQLKGTSSSLPKPNLQKAGSSDKSFWEEFMKFGQSATSQITGDALIGNGEIARLAKRDNKLSEEEAEAVRQRILKIYREYEEKRRQKRLTQEQVNKEETEEKKEKQQISQLAQRDKAVAISNPQIAKGRTEIGKNWGAE